MNMAEALNLGCVCSTLQPQLLRDELESRPGLAGLAQHLGAERPHLFSTTPVFISAGQYRTIARSIDALHRIAALPGYICAALQRAPAIAAHDFGPQGVFMGYDFHLAEAGPRLIEINTNAGGAFLHAAAARAHRACCTPIDWPFDGPAPLDQLDDAIMGMFRAEWRAQRGSDAPLRTVAIVDRDPGQQYLAPEFEMARQLFVANGMQAVVADPRQLAWRDGALWHPDFPAGVPVDLVYNRLTDFDLSDPANADLRRAYANGATVVTPNPRAHAVHADKRNLVSLSDEALLAACGATAEDRALLRAVVPQAYLVSGENADRLWGMRRELFFKPAAGYGSKAAYRGDKLTRRVWDEIVGGNFIAQKLVRPSERLVAVAGNPTRLKVDLRAYAYDGRIQLLAARTYSGQTTNFRTAGGGFSPVVVLPAAAPESQFREQTPSPACAC